MGGNCSGTTNSGEQHSDLYRTTVCADLREGTREKEIENNYCTRGMRLGGGDLQKCFTDGQEWQSTASWACVP